MPVKSASRLLAERGHALDEVVRRRWRATGTRPRARATAARSVSKLALSSRFDSPSARVGPGGEAVPRARRASAASCVGVVDAPVGEPEVDRLRARRSLRRAAPSPWPGAGRRGAAAGTRRRRRRRGPSGRTTTRTGSSGCTSTKSHASARCAPGPDRGAVDRGDRRLVELPQLADERLHADAQRLGRRARVEARACRPAATVDAVRSMPAQNASPVAGDEQRPHRRVGPARADRVGDRVAHLGRQRVLRLGPVERDAARRRRRRSRPVTVMRGAHARLVRMLTTHTPEPRPPTLCWSAKPLRIATCRSSASPRSCHQHSVSCATPVAPIGWPLASSPPDVFTGMRPVSDGLAVERRDAALALVEEPEVLDVEDLGDREAVVHLGARRCRDGPTPAIAYARCDGEDGGRRGRRSSSSRAGTGDRWRRRTRRR